MTLLSQICRVLSDCQRLPNISDNYLYHKYHTIIMSIAECYQKYKPTFNNIIEIIDINNAVNLSRLSDQMMPAITLLESACKL